MARVNYIIGAGLWGLTMARLIAEELGEPVLILESRPYLGGNSAAFFDAKTGIECHRHGSHIFHTSNKRVWGFITRFSGFTSYRHKVLATHAGQVYIVPINLLTINSFYRLGLMPEEARNFLEQEAAREGIREPANLEEKALAQIGRPLYEAFIKHYTTKQWGKAPKELPASIIARLPVRYSYDFGYFDDPWQGMPESGFEAMFARLCDHPLIECRLNCEVDLGFLQNLDAERIIYTGLPDALFGYKYGALEWRSLRFEWEALPIADFQGATVMNYTDATEPFTRVHEFKHYNPERREIFAQPQTVICREYPKAWQRGDAAYYPISSRRNQELYESYAAEAGKAKIILGGRLGSYKYLDMDKAIADAMQAFAKIKASVSKPQ